MSNLFYEQLEKQSNGTDLKEFAIAELEKIKGRLEVAMWYNRRDKEYCLELIDKRISELKEEKKYETEVITRGNCMMCGKELTEGLFFCKECEEKANSRK